MENLTMEKTDGKTQTQGHLAIGRDGTLEGLGILCKNNNRGIFYNL